MAGQLDFLGEDEYKELIFVGFSTKKDLSLTILKEALKYNSSCTLVTPHNPQDIPIASTAFPPASEYLQQRLKPHEITGLKRLLQRSASPDWSYEKNSLKERMGIAIKQLVILDHALYMKEQSEKHNLKYDVKVLSCLFPQKTFKFLQYPDHAIYVCRQNRNFLRL